MEFDKIKPYIGNLAQVCDVKNYRIEGGRADGVRATDVTTASGLQFTVAADRAMDIPSLRYCGINIGFMTPNGLASPYYYESQGIGFLRNFAAGFLTTCGFSNIGNPSSDEAEELGLHGRLSNLPAEEYSVTTEKTEEDLLVHISGKMRQARLFGENITLKREIIASQNYSVLQFVDTVTNEDLYRAPYMHLYHLNIGYPFLSPDSRVYLPSLSVRARTEDAKSGLSHWQEVEEPIAGANEMCFYHEMQMQPNGDVGYVVYNHALNMGMCVVYNGEKLDWFTQWKCMRAGAYVMGLEPANCHLDGQKAARENGDLKYLEPGEEVKLNFVVEFFSGEERLNSLIKRYHLVK